MSYTLFPLLFLALINLILAGFIFVNKKHIVNKLFAIFICFLVAWILSLFAIWSTFGKTTNLFWGRVIFAHSSLAALSFLWFAEAFPDKKTIVLKKVLAVFTFLGLVFALLSFSPAIVTRLQYARAGQYRPVSGPLYPLFAFYFLSCFGYAFFILGRKWRKARGINKLQIQYLFLGMLLFCVSAAIINLIIPIIFNAYQFAIYGPYFSLFFVGFTSHAIIRYRLMDIKAIVSRSILYFFSSAIAVAILLVLFFPVRNALAPNITIPKEALIIATALSSIIFFFPLKSLFQFLLNKYFYHEPYDYQGILRNTSQALSVLEFRELLAYLSKMIVHQMQIESASIFLEKEGIFQRQSMKQYFNPVDLDGKAKDAYLEDLQQISVKESSVIRELQSKTELYSEQEKFLVREELARQFENPAAQKVSEELSSFGYDAAFPLTFENQLIGVLFVGAKLSGEPYFQPDLELLSTVSNQSTIAIRNAQLYTEVNWMKEYNENILLGMESGVITVNSNEIITTFNEAAERLIDIDKQEAIRKEVAVLGSEFSGLILDALHRGKLNHHTETTITTKDEREIPIIFSTSLLKNEQGKISDCIMVFNDLSKVKETEEKRQKMQRLAILGSLASGILHEVKNSLIPLKTFAELLPENYSDPEFRDDYSKIVLSEMDQVNSLLDRLRDLTHFSPGNFTSVKVSSSIEDALSLLKAEIQKSNVQVTKEYAQELPEIMLDKSRIRQLFLNLFMNSLQFMPDGGNLHIKTFAREFLISNFVVIEISDTGTGIAEEDLEKIFDPFFTTREEEGTGLGLTICQNIVDAHKGNISMRNNEKKGVTVTVSFPIPKKID